MKAPKTIRLPLARSLESNDLKAIQDHLKQLYDELDRTYRLLFEDAQFGGDIIVIGTADGQMLFWNNTTKTWVPTEASELYWDDTNKRIGINSIPSEKLDVGGTVRATRGLFGGVTR